MKYIIGAIIGWFVHAHYSEQILALFNRVTGQGGIGI
jgi:hypothetical protein